MTVQISKIYHLTMSIEGMPSTGEPSEFGHSFALILAHAVLSLKLAGVEWQVRKE